MKTIIKKKIRMIHLHHLVLTLLLLSGRLSNASSDERDRDSNYYAAHGINPNVRESHFYADSNNVLQSLSEFDKLYVTYSGCVWSTYDHEDHEDSCGERTKDEYWYMGATECFRTNAAYSLYGVLKGQDDNGCTQGTFINSFFTTAGVEAFTQSMVATGQISFSAGNTAHNNDGDDGEENGNYFPGGVSSLCQTDANDNGRLLGEDEDNIQHNTKYNSDLDSTGLTCYKKMFVKKIFQGPYCDRTSKQTTVDDLSTFNAEINGAQCIPIYDSSSKNGNNQDNNDDEGGSLSLLYNSQSCDIREYPHGCPDPFAKLKQYAAASEKAVSNTYHSTRSNAIRGFSILFLVLGGILILCAIVIYLRRSRLARLRAIKRKIKQTSLGRKQGKVGDSEQENTSD